MESAVAETVLSEMVKAAKRHARYLFCYSNYVEDFQRNKTELMITRESVEKRSERAKQETKEIDTAVINWLEQTNLLIEGVQKLEDKTNSSKSYCFGPFPNWIWRYRVSKLVEVKSRALTELNQKSNFQEFAHFATLPGMEYFSSKDFIFFESTRIAYGQLFKALTDHEVSMVGLYGMGGCGKTTLAKQVGKAAEETFDKVAFAVVSNNVDVQKIQGEIASYLGLHFEEKELVSGRARTLWKRLTSGEKILIILDDVWGKLDFETIGIPMGENHKGCKVLLTTRRSSVCTLMHCQKIISLSLLNEEEAWILFQQYSGIVDETSNSLKSLPKDITKECKGLPIAIVAVASTLKGKSASEWEEALERLQEATPIDVEEGLRDPYKCLQLSYDNLTSGEAKSLFLLCSVFPEDFEIHEEYLARYGIGLGLFGKTNPYARARNKLNEAKNKLIDSCLLLKGENEQCVKMHDLVRDIALIIAKQANKKIMEIGSSARSSRSEANISVRYLWYLITQESDKLSYLLDCQNLEFLYVKISQNSILEDEVFKTMKNLRVLVIQGEQWNTGNLSMAKSIEWLTNLRCLFLEEWILDDISFIGSLKRLESLALWSCSFKELPDKITELPKLRLLDLRSCQIERNPVGVIRKCSQIEELYFLGDIGGWLEEEEIGVAATSGLKRYRISVLRRSFDYESEKYFSITRGLWSDSYDALTSSAAIQDLAGRAEFLELSFMKNVGCKNIIPDLVNAKVGGMNQLTQLVLFNCPKIECVVDTSNPQFKIENAFSNLLKIDISYMNGLETLWRGPHVGNLNLCHSLKMLLLFECPKLTSAFTCAVARRLVALEQLTIVFCHSLKHIVSDEENSKDNDENHSAFIFPKLQTLYVSKCFQLEYVFGESSSNHEDHNQNRLHIINLPILKKLDFDYLPNMKAICPENYCLLWPSLKQLKWEECEKLKVESINNCIVDGSQVINVPPQEQQLDADVMHDTQTINQLSISQTLQSIEFVIIRGCENIEGIFQLPRHPTSEDQQPLTSCLKYLVLYDLNELSYIFKGPSKFILLQNLQQLRVHRCEKLKFIFSTTIIGSLPLLEKLDIFDCPQLEQIIESGETQEFLKYAETNKVNHWNQQFHNAPEKPETSKCLLLYKWLSKPLNIHKLKKDRKDQSGEIAQDEKDQNSSINHSQQVCFPRLTSIEIKKCNNLKYLIVILSSHELPQLNELNVEECSLLENVFACKEINTEGEEAVMFSKLRKLRLIKLPNLVNVYKGFKWDSVNDKQVEDCPKLTSTTTAPFRDLPQEHHNQESRAAHKTQTDAILTEKKEVQSRDVLTDPKENKDINEQTSISQDVNLTASFRQTNQEYQTSEKGGNVEKMDDKNATDKSTTSYPEITEAHETLAETSLPESTLQAAPSPQLVPKENNQTDSSVIKSDKITNIEKGKGDLQIQEFNTSINHFNAEESLQEPDKKFRENMKENAKEDYQKCFELEKLTESTNNSVSKASESEKLEDVGRTSPISQSFSPMSIAPGDPKIDLDFYKEKNVEQKMHQVNSQNKEEEFVDDLTLIEQQKSPDEMKAPKELQLVASTSQIAAISASSSQSSGESSVDLPTPADEYATFRDIGAIKKKHVPLLEKAFAKCPSLWDWHKKFKHPQIKQSGYSILGDMLEFLKSTRWRDLNEEKKTEFESFVNDLEAIGIDIQWLGNTHDKIKQNDLDEGSIKRKKTLEEQVAIDQHKVEEIKVHLQMAESKLQKSKQELIALEAELGNYNEFIGF